MRIVLHFMLSLLVLGPSLGFSADSCLSPSEQSLLDEKIREVEKKQYSLKPSSKGLAQDKDLFELQKEYDRLMAKEVLYEGILSLKESYYDYKEQIKEWDEEKGTSLRDKDFGEVMQTIDAGLANMHKIDALTKTIKELIKRPVSAQRYPEELQKYDHADTVIYHLVNGGQLSPCEKSEAKNNPICNILLNKSEGNLSAQQTKKMLKGFAKAYAILYPETDQGSSKSPEHIMKAWEIRKEGLEEYLGLLSGNEEFFNELIAEEIQDAEETKQKLKKQYDDYQTEYNKARGNKASIEKNLDNYYGCLALTDGEKDCAKEHLPSFPLGKESSELIKNFASSASKAEDAARETLLEKIKNNPNKGFKKKLESFEKKINKDDSFLGGIKSLFSKEQTKSPLSGDDLLKVGNDFFNELNCGSEMVYQEGSKLKFDQVKTLQCIDEISKNESQLNEKRSAINAQLDDVKKKISDIMRDSNSEYVRLDFIKRNLIIQAQEDCYKNKNLENDNQELFPHQEGDCYPDHHIDQNVDELRRFVGNAGKILDEQNKSNSTNQKADESGREVEVAEDESDESDLEAEIAEDTEEEEKEKTQREKDLEYEVVDNEHTNNLGRAFLGGIVKSGVSTGMTWLSASAASRRAEEAIPNAINQIQYDHNLFQAAMQFGYDQNGNINFPPPFTQGLAGQPGGTTFFRNFSPFFDPTIGFNHVLPLVPNSHLYSPFPSGSNIYYGL